MFINKSIIITMYFLKYININTSIINNINNKEL